MVKPSTTAPSARPGRTASKSFFLLPKLARHFSVVFLLASLCLEPATASAGFFSIVAGFFDGESVPHEEVQMNSQNMPLLEAANHYDPRTTKISDVTIIDKSALLASTGPSGTAADIESEEYTSDQISVYVVKEGDTVDGIAKLFKVTPNTVVWANNLENKKITPGTTLVILPVTGVTYTVKKGDTLESIAKKLKSDADEIADFNGVGADRKLAVGLEIVVPDGEKEAPVVIKKPSSVAKKPTLGLAWPAPAGVLTQGLHGHNGVDIGAPIGSRIVAAAAGTVIISRDDGGYNGGYGNYVVISHPNGTQTLYAHNTSNSVRVGQKVDKGQTIGAVGNTGRSTGPHVHFEVRGAANPFAR